jgi:hypothetical protein
MKKLIIICLLLAIVTLINAQQKDFPSQKLSGLTGPYLGQKPPEMTPERFAENVIGDNFYPHSKMMVAPDGNRIYWSTFIDTVNADFALYYSDFDGKNLSMPKKDTVISKYGIYSFLYSINGETIYFGTQQPLPEYEGKKIYGVWYSKKEHSQWSNPQPVKSTLDSNWASVGSLSMNIDGDIYFAGRYKGNSAKIYFSKSIMGKYQKPEPLPEIINSGIALDPFIDPQNRYLLFTASRRSDNIGEIDLYVSFRNNNGYWEKPINLGENICTKYMDRFPMVTSDGKYLFFVTSHSNHFPSTYTHYHWVSAKIIEELRSKE